MTTVFDTRTNERLIADWARLLSEHELDDLLQLFTDEVIYEDVAVGVVNHGRAALRTFAAHFILVFPDVTMELSSSFATATRGGAEWVMRGTQMVDLPDVRARGQRMEVRGASILEFAQGKIQRVSDYWDRNAFLKQLR